MLQNPKNNFYLIRRIRSSLFFRLSTLIIVFSIILVAGLVWGFRFSFDRQDSILDAHEAYFYSNMVESWGSPPDTFKVIKDITNLNLQCAIYNIENDYSRFNATEKNSPKYWSSSSNFPSDVFYYYQGTEDFKRYNVNIPLHVEFGLISDLPSTAVEFNDYVFYLGYSDPDDTIQSNMPTYLLAISLTIIFIITLSFFTRKYLYPVQLVKNRLLRLEDGDLESQIPILGEDELAILSKGINKIILEINSLINQKHQLLLDVSHELRSPLSRMKLLLEMIPKHTNKTKLNNEVSLLEGMISNLLLSDKLSIPYKNLNLSSIKINSLIDNIMAMFPGENRIIINNIADNIEITVDTLKLQLAIRNLIDNAIKYNNSTDDIIFDIYIEGNNINFKVTDFGEGIEKEDIERIVEPFIRLDKSMNKVNGFGIGLTIAKKVIKAHKGKLIIVSNINKGSSFTLSLPIKRK